MDENIWPYQIKRNSRCPSASKILSRRNAWRACQGRREAISPAPSTPSAPVSSLSVVGVGERRLGSRAGQRGEWSRRPKAKNDNATCYNTRRRAASSSGGAAKKNNTNENGQAGREIKPKGTSTNFFKNR